MKKPKFAILAILVALALFIIIVMVIESGKPARIVLPDFDGRVKGEAFIRTNQMLIGQMRENWLPNDIFWPTVLLDNMPNFQIGVLEVVRYNVRVLRDNLSRMRTTDKLDSSVEGAFTALSNDPYKWWFPSAEDKWKTSYESLETFYQNLHTGKSHFFPRSDNLVELLSEYASLMGGANTRLIHAPRDTRTVLSVDGESAGRADDVKSVEIDIPWYHVDDNFYYAQGISYGLYESFNALRNDFFDVLTDKNSIGLVDRIIEDLGKCYFEPIIVFNGAPDSVLANHSLNLSGMFNDARQKIHSLIIALKQG